MQLVKSPLNYTGNKYRIMDQMRRHFPENIECMVDLFCGGATVGLNKTGKATKMRAYLEAMKQADDYLEEWSVEAWVLMVETATVNRDKTITFKFVNGKEVRV